MKKRSLSPFLASMFLAATQLVFSAGFAKAQAAGDVIPPPDSSSSATPAAAPAPAAGVDPAPPTDNTTPAPSPSIASSGDNSLTPGESEVTFTQRSPQTQMHELSIRYSQTLKSMGADYDLSQLPFVMYVPPLDPAHPPGVMVYLNYKATNGGPTTIYPILDKQHLIFITPKISNNLPPWQQAALAIDAVYNLKQRTPIDESRVMLMAFQGGEAIGLSTPDIFTWQVWTIDVGYFRQIHVNNKDGSMTTYNPTVPMPSLLSLPLAKRRSIVVATDTDNADDAYLKLLPDALKREGFAHLLVVPTNPSDVHYPQISADWFQKVVDFLAAVPQEVVHRPLVGGGGPRIASRVRPRTGRPAAAPLASNDSGAATPPAPAPPADQAPAPAPAAPVADGTSSDAGVATPPAAAPPAVDPTADASADPSAAAKRLINLAQSYIEDSRPDMAREKLNEVLEKYPNDPSAATARKMLDQISGQ